MEAIQPIPLDKWVRFAQYDGKLYAFYVKHAKTSQIYSYALDEEFGIKEERLIYDLPDIGDWLDLQCVIEPNTGIAHFFLLNDARTIHKIFKGKGEEERPLNCDYSEISLNIWHLRYDFAAGRVLKDVEQIWSGYCGALNSVVLLTNGRLLLPFSYKTTRTWRSRGDELSHFSFYGQYNTQVLYTDNGSDFKLSNALTAPVPDIVSAYGAIEPVCVALPDQTVWMLIRTQNGRLYQSFSPDGASWLPPTPTDLIASDSPAGICRMQDDRIVVFLNQSLRFPYAYGGRHKLHCAISADNGKSFSGFVEIASDPYNHVPPPSSGDHGTAYPFPFVAPDGTLLLTTGQGEGRMQHMRVNVDQLLGQGLGFPSCFGTDHIQAVNGCLLLSEGLHESCAYNFPARKQGSIRIKLADISCDEIMLQLTDHFSVPFDQEDYKHSVFTIRVKPSEEIILMWDENASHCTAFSAGSFTSGIRRRSCFGVNYLRISTPEQGCFTVNGVELIS